MTDIVDFSEKAKGILAPNAADFQSLSMTIYA